MKKVLLIGCGMATALLAVCGGGIGLVVYFVLAASGPPVTATEQFFTLLGQEKTAEAYATTASELQEQQSEEEFTEMVNRLWLWKYQASMFLDRRVEKDRATLKGTVTLSDGVVLPMVVQLVKEGETWKVLSIDSPQVGPLIIDPAPPPEAAPDEK